MKNNWHKNYQYRKKVYINNNSLGFHASCCDLGLTLSITDDEKSRHKCRKDTKHNCDICASRFVCFTEQWTIWDFCFTEEDGTTEIISVFYGDELYVTPASNGCYLYYNK